MQEIWTEKYRPKKLKEMTGQKDIIERLQTFVKNKNIPHCMFAGPAGCGKTTAALCVAYELYGDRWKSNVLELNASVTSDTPILIKRNGKVKRTNFAELDKIYFSDDKERISVNDLEVLSLDDNYKIKFIPINYLFRHKKNKIAVIHYEGGTIKVSLDHSVFTVADDGSLISKKAEEMKPGDFLITFKTVFEGNSSSVNVQDIRPKEFSMLRSGKIKNPKIKASFTEFGLDEDFSWLLGLYLAEGCTSLSKEGTSGQTIFTVAYPKEVELGNKVKNLLNNMDISVSTSLGKSGFDRTRESSLQIRAMNTQLTRFMRRSFYDSEEKNARTKRVPNFIYSSPVKSRILFLNGYFQGDGSGEWEEIARLSSVSQECLIDAAWLGRLSGLETSCFERETRIIWKIPKFSYIKSDLIPSFLLHTLNNQLKLEKTRELRHSLYGKKSSRISKVAASSIINDIKIKNKLLDNIKKFINSDLSVVKIKSIDIIDYDDYVYDVSVPGSQMFWGGTIPILLHNSDERGIDTIRIKVKDFARTISLDKTFKIIYLDEADSLTRDAQHALRRTMEKYSDTARFILACNYSSKIIQPIQSRTAVFRFSQLTEDEIIKFIKNIAKNEKLEIDENAYKAIVYSSEGDMRKAINILQAASTVKGKITQETIYKVTTKADPQEVKKMLLLALDSKFKESRQQLLHLLYTRGLAGEDIIKEIHSQVFSLEIEDEKKLHLIEKVGEYEFRLTEGSNPRIQLEALLAQFGLSGKK